MSEGAFEKSEKLMRLIGEALVTWSEIEALWRMMLPHLLFRDFKHPKEEAAREVAGRGDDELSIAEERGYALWDGLNNSAAQLDLVLKVARLVLIDPAQEKGLGRLLSLGSATHTKRSKRNALAHGAFDRGIHVYITAILSPIVYGDGLQPARHAHSAIRGQDLEVVIPQFIEEFRRHREDVRQVWSWLRFGRPKDAGAP